MKLDYKQRSFIWQFLTVGFFVLIWVELFNLQIIQSPILTTLAKKQYSRPPILLRGEIRDRNGNLLVLDYVTYDIYNNIEKLSVLTEEKINRLAELLKISATELDKRLRTYRVNTKICGGINESTANKIDRELKELAYSYPKIVRLYPHNKMASHIIGFVNADHMGQHGVEYFHQDLITKPSFANYKSLFQKGTDIALTIDSVLQEYAEEELSKAIKSSKANRGSVIVLSPKTGEIYAWAVYPSFNPNFFFREKAIKNWAITDIYQPGSTFKILTISSGLENMTIDKNFSYFDTGVLKISNRIIRNHNKTKPQNINLLELFKQSSNIASAQVGLSMNPEMFYNSIKKFMIGTKTNIDLPGESNGLLLDYKKWKTLDLATTAFGQGAVSVTPIQLACAVSAVANHGIWVQPHVLKGTWDSKYKLINESPYEIDTEQVISPEVAEYVSGLLKQSVKENLIAMAYIAGNVEGYEVAGKTGTAQKIRSDGKGYWGGHTVASFIGYLPADNPQILTLVVIDDPKTGGGWGNTVCGPVFNKVAKMAAKRILES